MVKGRSQSALVYADIDIRIQARQDRGYPLFVAFDGIAHPYGYLPAELAGWTATGDSLQDGERLFDQLLADPQLRLDWQSAQGHSAQRRIRLGISSDAPELHALPWELLRDHGEGQALHILAADAATPMSRYLAARWEPRDKVAVRPARLVVTIADPENLDEFQLAPIDRTVEQAVIEAVTAELPSDDLEVTIVPQPVTLASIEAELRKGCDLLHIVAHGAADERQGRSFLFLADERNQARPTQAMELAEMLQRQADLPVLVFLASCQSAKRYSSDAFRGFVPELVQAGIPAVLAMQDVVPLETARRFSSVFYRQLLEHGLVDLAANQARSTLLTEGERFGWSIPVLYSQVQSGSIIAPRPKPPEAAPATRFLIGAGGLLLSALVVLALLVGLRPDLCRWLDDRGYTPRICRSELPLPAGGFRVGVAEFQAIRELGQPLCATNGRQLSDWLFDGLSRRPADLPEYVPYEVVSPGQLGQVSGENPADREERAKQIAAARGITILIYGTITGGPDNTCQVAPVFYASPAAFDYAQEVIGANRLGAPVNFQPPLENVGTLRPVNRALAARVEALRFLIAGLEELYTDNFAAAQEKFSFAAAVPDWAEQDGKEVVYLLQGATELQRFNAIADPAQRAEALASAQRAFERANRIAPAYARSYLGLGTVTFLQAHPDDLCNIDVARLAAARNYYEAAQQAQDQANGPYVNAVAQEGLGQIHVAAVEAQSNFLHGRCPARPSLQETIDSLSGYSFDQAQAHFEAVIGAADANSSPEFKSLAADARANLGRIARDKGDWANMATYFQEAIRELTDLGRSSSNLLVAQYWGQIGYAESQLAETDAQAKQDHLLRACTAYGQALDLGQGLAGSDTVSDWQRRVDELKKEGAEGCP